MNHIVISKSIEAKLSNKHGVCRREVEQCFENLSGAFLIDNREEHKTTPPTLWFIAETNQGRLLKVIFVRKGCKIHIKSCYQPSQQVIDIYNKLAY